jgi:hypothetical protein
MQTQYNVLPEIGVEGLTQGPRSSRPRTLPQLAQITLLTVTAGGETDDLVVTVVDDETGQSYSFTATGSATEATLLTNALAAFAAHDQLPLMFSLAGEVDTDVLLTFSAKHSNRTYTFSATGGTATADPVASSVQAAGGDGLEFGRFVARGSADYEFAAPGASTTVADLLGVLFRTDANHFRLTDGDTAASVDKCARGKTYSIAEQCRMLFKVEDAVAPGDTPYMRRAGTGRLGGLRATPDGDEQTTVLSAFVADLATYTATLRHRGVTYHASYTPTDGTTAVADAIDGLFDSLVDAVGGATPAANGIGLTITEDATTLTIVADAGTAIDDLVVGYGLDTEAPAATVTIGSADVEAIDVSSICSFESSAAAGELAWVKINMGAR